ncbi:MAG: membrane integrity-associated transporter subunit PqiC [Hyphomicrobiales bacterium]|nr:membrane integrity-associated transporter subunit PqiC [Hyphomicrobiales bacterium]
MKARIAIAFAILGLTGCATAPRTTYDLQAAAPAHLRAGAVRGVIAISEPTAHLPIDSDRIVIRTGADSVAYLSGAQWADRLPALVQSRLIASFENAHLVRSVVQPGMTADYRLETEIRRFEIDVVAGVARIEMTARILSDNTGRVRAAHVFQTELPADSTRDGQAARTLDAALRAMMADIVRWTAAQI